MSITSKLRHTLLRPERPVLMRTLAILAALTLLLDQATKWWALAWLRGHPPVVIIPSFLQFDFRTNTGAAFSIGSDYPGVLTVVTFCITLGVAAWAWRLPPAERGMRPAFGLILGGALGNLIDRVRFGHVVDFIDAHWRYQAHWPTFNVADSAICIGMAWLFAMMLCLPNPKARHADAKPQAPTGGPAKDES